MYTYMYIYIYVYICVEIYENIYSYMDIYTYIIHIDTMIRAGYKVAMTHRKSQVVPYLLICLIRQSH